MNRHHSLSAGVTTVVLLFAFVSFGQSQRPTQTHVAESLRHRGVEAARAGEWEQARTLFARAYEIHSQVLTLYNLAAAEMNCGGLVEADAHFRRFLMLTRDGRHSDFRDAAEASRASLEERIAHLQIVVDNLEETDRLQYDDTVLAHAALAEELPINPGTHTLQVVRYNDTIHSEEIELAEGQRRQIRVELPRRSAPTPTEGGRPSSHETGDLVRSPGPHPAYGIVVASLAVVAGGVLVWSGLDTLSRNEEYEDYAQAPNASFNVAEAHLTSAEKGERRTNALIGASVGLGLAAVTLLLLSDFDRSTTVAVDADETGAQLTVGGTFK